MGFSKVLGSLMRRFFWRGSEAGKGRGALLAMWDMVLSTSQFRRSRGVTYTKYECGAPDKIGVQNHEGRGLSYEDIVRLLWHEPGLGEACGTSLRGLGIWWGLRQVFP